MITAAGTSDIHFSGILITLVAILGFVLTTAALFASVVVYRINKNAETTKTYKENAQAWKERSELQETEITDLKNKVADQDNMISDLRGQVHTLQEVVTGRAAISELGLQLARDMENIRKEIGEHDRKVFEYLKGLDNDGHPKAS